MNKDELWSITQKARKDLEDNMNISIIEQYKEIINQCIIAAQKGEDYCSIFVGETTYHYAPRMRLTLLIKKLEENGFMVARKVLETGSIYLRVMW